MWGKLCEPFESLGAIEICNSVNMNVCTHDYGHTHVKIH